MQKIVPHLWFDQEAKAAADFYTSIFEDAQITFSTRIKDTPSGDCDLVGFQILGCDFMAISAGPAFQINPAISFLIRCRTEAEVEALWEKLSPGGTPLMPLGEYPFSKRYGWLQDRFQVSWQLMHSEGDFSQRIAPFLMFVGEVAGQAEAALNFYASLFPQGQTEIVSRFGAGEAPEQEGSVKYGQMTLAQQDFVAMDSAMAHAFAFNEAVSFVINCQDQAEIDHYWSALSAQPEAEACGWLKDKYGLSWQIVPANLQALMERNPAKTTPTLLAMKKSIVAELTAAGAEA